MAVTERVSLRNLYLYLVCLITLVVSLFAAVQLVRSVVELFYPDRGYYYAEPAVVDGKDEGISKAEQKRQRDIAEEQSRRQAVLGIVGSGTTLLIAGPLYLYHWRRVQHELAARPSWQSLPRVAMASNAYMEGSSSTGRSKPKPVRPFSSLD